MTTFLDTAAIEEARARDGAPRDDRPQAADDALKSDEERVGYQSGSPLLDRPYDDYTTGDDVLRPDMAETLEALADHELVGDVADMASELRADEETVRQALELHDIEEPTGGGSFDVVTEAGAIDLPLHGTVEAEHFRSPIYTDARLLSHLYVRCGYGIEDIKQYLEAEMNEGRNSGKSRWSVRVEAIRTALEDVGLLEFEGTERNTVENEDVRLGGTNISEKERPFNRGRNGGVNLDVSDF